jgi:integrase
MTKKKVPFFTKLLDLEWRHVDFNAGSVRLDVGTRKNGDARVSYMAAALRRVLEARRAEQLRVQQAGHIQQLVFFRLRAKERGGELRPVPVGSFKRAWLNACRAAGVPGRRLHDRRRTPVRDLERAGVSRTVAMKLVGPRTESMYARYNITSDGDLRLAAQKLDTAVPVATSRTAVRD